MDIVFGTPPEAPPRIYSDYAEEMETRMKTAYSDVWRHLGVAASRNKKYYDMRVTPKQFKTGDLVYYFSPRKYSGHQDKWLQKYSSPFEVIKMLGPVNVVLQKTPRSVPFTTHIDKVKPFPGPSEQYDGSPEATGSQEVGGSYDVTTPTRGGGTERPRRQIKLPARFRE